MSRTAVISLLLLCITACRDIIVGTVGELRFGSPRIDFPLAYPGQVKQQKVELINTGRSTRTAHLTTVTPFGVEQVDVEVPGASTLNLDLTFSPAVVGHVEQLLQLEADDGAKTSTLLSGTADPPPVCASSNPCRSSAFMLTQGVCLEAPTNEGIDCTESNACYQAATCVGGECLGTAIDCDDADACSTDLCDPARGCIHFPNTARCPAPPDACHVPVCDRRNGCTFDDAPDGTRCGPSDCSTANICLLGQCRTLAVPEGAACGDESPCQPRGRCTANTCVRPPPQGLTVAWTAWASEANVVDWDAIADPAGNIYWRERVPGEPTSRITSVTPNGTLRWKQEVTTPIQVALIDGVLMIRQPGGIEARRLSDGEVMWTRDFSTPTQLASTKAYARGVGGSLYLGYARSDGGFLTGSTITSLNVFNGATLWQAQLPAQQVEEQTMPVDENGYLYVGTWGSDSKRRYLGFTPSGVQRWSFVNPHASPAAVFGGRVYHWDHWLSETTDGGWVNERDPALQTSGYPRLALGAISYVGTEIVDAGSCGAPGLIVPSIVMKLVRVDPPTSREKWTLEIASPTRGGGVGLTNPVLTSRSTVVFSQATDYCSMSGVYVLREVSASGDPTFSCPLPMPETYFGEGLLSGGKWIAAIRSPDGGRDGVRAIELPGFELPEHGWATAWGNSSRDNHSR